LTEGSTLQTFNIQDSGGTRLTVAKGIEMVKAMLPTVNQTQRVPCSVAHISVGLQCGGSDGYSGISANPALGAAVDLLALARCKRLVGTPRSTFSYAAQAIFSAQQAQVHMVAGPNGSRTPSESCRLYNHTQPAYHAWMRYHEMPGMLLKSHEGLYRDCFLEFHDSPRSNDVFALEYTVPGREQ
jgi:hypothetical protein